MSLSLIDQKFLQMKFSFFKIFASDYFVPSFLFPTPSAAAFFLYEANNTDNDGEGRSSKNVADDDDDVADIKPGPREERDPKIRPPRILTY